jgi:dynein heavy chain
MKRAIMHYILRSPDERKRLHIDLLPRQFRTSNKRICMQGGFSTRLYPDWHEFVQKGKIDLQSELQISTIIHSSLLDWFQDFEHFKLLETDTMQTIGILGHSLDIKNFLKFQTTYRYTPSLALF